MQLAFMQYKYIKLPIQYSKILFILENSSYTKVACDIHVKKWHAFISQYPPIFYKGNVYWEFL